MYTGQPYLDSSLVNINDFQPVNHSPLEDQEQFLWKEQYLLPIFYLIFILVLLSNVNSRIYMYTHTILFVINNNLKVESWLKKLIGPTNWLSKNKITDYK